VADKQIFKDKSTLTDL